MADDSTSRLNDLRKIARATVLKVFENINPDAEGGFKLLVEYESLADAQVSSGLMEQGELIQEIKRTHASEQSTDPKERARILSLLVRQVTIEVTCRIFNERISKSKICKATSNLHALHFIAGASEKWLPFHYFKCKRSDIEFVLDFILDDTSDIFLAQGEKRITNSMEEMIALVNFQHKFDVIHTTLWEELIMHYEIKYWFSRAKNV